MADDQPQLPDKLYFKIGEVARLVGVKPYVLRYWETEFPSIRPGKTRSKHRLYRKRDVETLFEIKRLLHNERYTIEGAKRRLKTTKGARENEPAAGPAPAPQSAPAAPPQMALPLADQNLRKELIQVKRGLEAIYEMLK
jgi:DNA-binding transcriptional MerR regulator